MQETDVQTIELFCGTKSFSKVAASYGYATFTVDNDASHDPDLVTDILMLSSRRLPSSPSILWASPPCQTFSVLSISRYWNADGTPKTLVGHRLVAKTLGLIIELNPTWWFIENPRGMLRTVHWFDDAVRRLGGNRRTISYCQYGDTRQKPTDIWTNARWWKAKRPCAPGDPCHERVGRFGTQQYAHGTVGLKTARERSRIPPDLFTEIFSTLKDHANDNR